MKPGVALIQFDPEAVGGMAEEVLELVLPKGSNVALITTNKDYLAHQRIIGSLQGKSREAIKGRSTSASVMENQDKEEITYGIAELILKDGAGCPRHLRLLVQRRSRVRMPERFTALRAK